jgi:histone deacetylase complex regulatory component SIN3
MDALSYLREVKEHFKNEKAVYDIFLEIMKEFKARRCGDNPHSSSHSHPTRPTRPPQPSFQSSNPGPR